MILYSISFERQILLFLVYKIDSAVDERIKTLSYKAVQYFWTESLKAAVFDRHSEWFVCGRLSTVFCWTNELD